MNTIIYLTDNSLDEQLANRCRELLIREAKDIPIVSVSQKPIDLGLNVCVGEIGRSWFSLYKQLMTGLEHAQTEYVAIAEHDCIYSHEHLSWTPPTKDKFYYNYNHYLQEWGGNHPELKGLYSRWSRDRNALSQLVCSRELLLNHTKERLYLIEQGLGPARRFGEAGAVPDKIRKAAEIAVSGECKFLQPYLEDYLTKYSFAAFDTIVPNIDIRHGKNFTGPRRGKHRTYEIPYWGRFDELICPTQQN